LTSATRTAFGGTDIRPIRPKAALDRAIEARALASRVLAILGALAFAAVTRLLGSLVSGISASNPFVLLVSLILPLSVALAAILVPASRAARVGPLKVLNLT
jgi:hypothetical protein